MTRIKRTLKAITLLAVMTMTTFNASAQDLLARQAPVDRKMKAVDTLALYTLLDREQVTIPASGLYEDWSNAYVHRAHALPDSFKINLRNFCMPTTHRVITSNFGPRWGRMHKGLDIKVYIGDTIRAAFTGKVRIVRYEANGYGNYVVIRHDNGLETIYGHLSRHLVRENENVRAGDPIGLGGNTGRSTGSHLHFETRLCGVALNPALLFDFRAQDVTADTYMFRRSTFGKESAQANRLRGAKAKDGYNFRNVSGDDTPKNNSRAGNTDMAYGSTKRYHKVEAGETVFSIARKRGITPEELCKRNRIGKSTRIRPGQLLVY